MCIARAVLLTSRDLVTASRKNVAQCRVALDLLVDLVKVAKIDPSRIGVISPLHNQYQHHERVDQEARIFCAAKYDLFYDC